MTSNEVERTYIYVPFDEKDLAKKLGALWCNEKRSWFYIGDNAMLSKKFHKNEFKLFHYKNEIIWYKRHRSSPMGDMGRVYENIMVVCKGKRQFNETRIPYLDFITSMADITNIEGVKGTISQLTNVLSHKMRYEEALAYLEARENKTCEKRFRDDYGNCYNDNAVFESTTI